MDSNREPYQGKYVEVIKKDAKDEETINFSEVEGFLLIAKEANYQFSRIIKDITDLHFASEVAMLVMAVERLREVVNQLDEELPESFLKMVKSSSLYKKFEKVEIELEEKFKNDQTL